jgi:hypothetical protein
VRKGLVYVWFMRIYNFHWNALDALFLSTPFVLAGASGVFSYCPGPPSRRVMHSCSQAISSASSQPFRLVLSFTGRRKLTLGNQLCDLSAAQTAILRKFIEPDNSIKSIDAHSPVMRCAVPLLNISHHFNVLVVVARGRFIRLA